MTKKSKKKLNQGKAIRLTLLGLVGLVLLVTFLLQGTDIALFNPQGRIASEQLRLILVSVTLLFEIGIPTLVLFYFVAWKYRESNDKATHDPHTHYGKFFVLGIWALPTAFMIMLALVMWPATHRLEPKKLIAAGTKPLTIQVVALRWKWLFIYPDQNIATVNYVQIPTDTSVQFELTADEAPMNSFWIPHLGGQLYAMTGHVNRLNLLAETPGEYTGRAAEINGAGFAGMNFTTRASSQEDFDHWVQDLKQSRAVLDTAAYQKLLEPSEKTPAAFYSKADPSLYNAIVMKYAGSHDHHAESEGTQ